MSNSLRVAHLAERCQVLGPGLRAVLWVQGCDKECVNCLNPELQPFNGGYLRDVKELADEIIALPDIEGLTLSGGEPFCQAEALVTLIDIIKASRDLSILSYTGDYLAEILKRRDPHQIALLQRLDILIDGPYIDEKACDFRWRGSSNQKVYVLTKRYRGIENLLLDRGRWVEFEVTLDGRFFWMGIPEKRFRDTLRERLRRSDLYIQD